MEEILILFLYLINKLYQNVESINIFVRIDRSGIYLDAKEFMSQKIRCNRSAETLALNEGF